MFHRRFPLHGLAFAGFLLGGSLRLGAELAANSPFLPPPGQVNIAAPTVGAPLEFRGVSQMGRNVTFSIFDPAKKTGTWVGMNESGYDFEVKKYDADSDTVTIVHQGRSLTLAMRTPKIASLGNAVAPLPAAAPMPVVANTPPNPLTRNVVATPTPATEAARLADWQAEIQRRRDARAQGVTLPAVTQPPAAVAPQAARPNQQQNQQQNAQRPRTRN